MGRKSRFSLAVLVILSLLSPTAYSSDQNIPCVNFAAAVVLGLGTIGTIGTIIFYKPPTWNAEKCAEEKNAAVSNDAKPVCMCPSNGKSTERWFGKNKCEPYEKQYESVEKELKKKREKAIADLEKEQKAKKPVAAKIEEATKRKNEFDKLETAFKAIPKTKTKFEDFNSLFQFHVELQKH